MEIKNYFDEENLCNYLIKLWRVEIFGFSDILFM